MSVYRMASVTIWQTEAPDDVRVTWSVFLRFGARDFETLARGEFNCIAAGEQPARAWLQEVLEHTPDL